MPVLQPASPRTSGSAAGDPQARRVGLAISPQSPDHSLSLTEQAELGFDVLSDVDQGGIRDYRLQFTLPADLQSVHLDVFDLDLRVQNADGSWNLPVPATFVINSEGRIAAAGVGATTERGWSPR